jgi:glycosyltransferase involved in cell wall biosynthesis
LSEKDSATLPDSAGLELLVVDGGSTDGTVSKLDELSIAFPRLKVLQNPERITSFALNRGIRAAAGEVIVRMDIHTTYADDYIAACLAALDETGADNVGGPWVAQVAGAGQRGRAQPCLPLVPAAGRLTTRLTKAPSIPSISAAAAGSISTIRLFRWKPVRAQDSEFNFRILLLGGKICRRRGSAPGSAA